MDIFNRQLISKININKKKRNSFEEFIINFMKNLSEIKNEK
jgi:hypothetical protein